MKHFLAALSLAVFCGTASAGGAGTTGAALLKLDLGAKELGMAGAATALSGDVYSLRYNPAGLALASEMEGTALLHNGVEDTAMEFVGGATPLDYAGLSGEGTSAAGFSFLFSQNGDIDWYQADSDGNALHAGDSRSAGSDFVLSLGYAEKVASGSFMPLPRQEIDANHYLGASVKVISSRLPDTDGSYASAGAVAFDGGYLLSLPDVGASFGAALLNVGTPLKYVSQREPLPVTARLGFAYKGFHLPKNEITVSLDGLRYLKEEENRLRLGLEFSLQKYAALRFGYKFLEDAGGLTAGIGMKWNTLTLDFGIAFDGELGSVYQLGLKCKFGKTPAAAPGRKSKKGVLLDVNETRPAKRSGQKKQPAPKTSGGAVLLY